MESAVIGKVVKEWGINGELKIIPIDVTASYFDKIDSIMLQRSVSNETNPQIETFDILNRKYISNTVVTALKGIDSIDKARLYRQALVLIDSEDLPELEEGEYLIHQIIGLSAITISDELIGEVKEILQTSASDIFVIKNGDKEILVPSVKEFIDEINIEKGYIKIRPIEGLL
ncbi:MAG: 16S rRNA processing protein RimM [Nitrospirae bacterium]|nr:16S rRNA processing protein RimM [Nitrospirota bacterium]